MTSFDMKEAVKNGYNILPGKLMRAGGLYPSYEGTIQLRVLSVAHSFMAIFVHTLFVVSLAVTTTLTKNMFILNQAFHFSIMISVPLFCALNTIFKRQTVNTIFEIVGKGFFNYSQFDFSEEIATRRKYVKYFILFWYSAVQGATLIMSAVYLTSDIHAEYNGKTVDGVSYDRFVPMWFPVYLPPLVSYANEIYGQLMFTLGVVAVDGFFVAVSNELLMQLKILKISIRKIHARATDKMSSRLKNKILANHYLTEEDCLKDCYQECLKENVIHHQQIIKCFDCLQSWVFWPLLVTFASGALLICFSALNITEKSVSPSILLASFLILVEELNHVFLYCIMGELLIQSSEEIGEELYFSPWNTMGLKVKNTVILIMIRSSRHFKLNFAGLFWLSLHSFTMILRASYSYFNVVRATRE